MPEYSFWHKSALIAHGRYVKILRDSEALGTKFQIFHDSIVSQFPEETWPK